MKCNRFALLVLAAVATAAGAASANQGSASGQYNGLSWTAQSLIVGVTPTASGTLVTSGGGDPTYFATAPAYSGVVSLILTFGASGSFICSGSLLADRQSILTAAHCVTSGPTLSTPTSATAYFYGGASADVRLHSSPASTAVAAASYFVNPLYTGDVVDHNDIAVIRLAAPAPAFAASYGLFTGDLTGMDFNVAGVGGRSTVGGSLGTNAVTGYRRQGDNRYEYRMGDTDFAAGAWASIIGSPLSQIGYSFLSDFDNGIAANDAGARLSADPFLGGLSGPKFVNLGRGAREVSVAGGDSGGPQFSSTGLITSVTSYGLTFGTAYGDVDGALNSTFGEFNGFVPVSIHTAFIAAAMVPEPGTYAMMALGLAAIGLARRRRRRAD